MAKTLTKAYLIWLFGGYLGLHHAYLRRDKRAFIWFTTLGGFFFGYLFDLFLIPRYVKEANEDPEYKKKQEKKMSEQKAPAFEFFKFVGCIVIGSFFSYLTKHCFYSTEETYFNSFIFPKILAPLIISYVIYCYGSEGPVKCNFKWIVFGAFISNFLNIFQKSYEICNSPFYATIFLNWTIEWDRNRYEKVKNERKLKRVLVFLTRSAIVFALFGTFIWHNATVEMDGEKMTLKQWGHKLINGPDVQRLISIVQTVWNFYQTHGIFACFNAIFYGTEKISIDNAYKVHYLTVLLKQLNHFFSLFLLSLIFFE